MTGSMSGIEKYRGKQADEAREKTERAIIELQFMGKEINFNSISKQSGVSKSFLYKDVQTKNRIEELRNRDVSIQMNQRAKFDQTAKSKDVLINAKDRRISKLEAENQKLKCELERLRGLIYDTK